MKHAKAFISFFLIFVIFLSVSFAAFLLIPQNFEGNQKAEPESDTQKPSPPLPTIIIDAGHGGEDGGAIGTNGAYEKDINLAIALKLKTRLDKLSIPCVLTRSTDTLLYDKTADHKGRKKKLDLLARKEFAEQYENAIFISIHQNSFTKSQYRGFQIYYSPNSEDSLILASSIEEWVSLSYDDVYIRPSKKSDSSIYLLENLQCPAILIECGFISNPQDCALLCQESYQDALVSGISKAVSEFVN